MPPQTVLQQAVPSQNQVPAAAAGSATADGAGSRADAARTAAQAGYLAASDAPNDTLTPPASGDIGINNSVDQGAGAGAPVLQGQVRNTVRRLYSIFLGRPSACTYHQSAYPY